MSKTRLGVVGCGGFGNFHLDRLLARNDVEVASLATANEERLHKTGKKAPEARLYKSAHEMMEKEKRLDALVVCVPPHRHENIEREAAAKGIHLYVEKPLGVNFAEANETAKIIKKSGIITSVGYQTRYEERMSYFRKIAKADGIGTIEARWIDHLPNAAWWRLKGQSGGQVVEQSTHIVDLLRYLCGEAAHVWAAGVKGMLLPMGRDRTVDDYSIACIRFRNNASASLITGCYLDDNFSQVNIGFTVYCSNVCITYVWNKYFEINDGRRSEKYFLTQDNYMKAMDAFIGSVQNRKPQGIQSDYADALKTLALTLAIEESIESGQSVPMGKTALLSP